MLSEINQLQKTMYCMKCPEWANLERWQISGCLELGGGGEEGGLGERRELGSDCKWVQGFFWG